MRFSLQGVSGVTARLRDIQHMTPRMLGRAVRTVAEVEMTEAKKRTPVDTGALRSSGHVTGPVVGSGSVDVQMVFGGPATEYALQVHENLEAFHRVGQAKYLESVVEELRPFFALRVARVISERF